MVLLNTVSVEKGTLQFISILLSVNLNPAAQEN